jgi:hypothetical protein
MLTNPNMIEEYKHETDYRKIPREYLETNIPQGRGIVKWAAFKTIPEQYETLEQFMKDQNKIEQPNLFDDEISVLNKIIQSKIYLNEIALVKYWKNGYFYNHKAYIKEVDVIKQNLILSNEQGNQTLEIPLKNIKSIE